MFKRVTLTLAGLLLATACAAQGSEAPFTAGNQYDKIAHPERYSPKGKVEVVEVFSYGCIHCYHFSADADTLSKSLPKNVDFHYVPASFSPAWEPYARAFYAAQELGILKRTHLALFKAKFYDHYPLNSLSDMADFYAKHGTTAKAFLKAAHSHETDRKLARSNALIKDWGVQGTPTIVVDGKYRSGRIKTYAELLKLTHWLVQRELKAKGQH